MLDTNIFDAIINLKIDLSKIANSHVFFVTHIQRDEIEKINNPNKEQYKQKLKTLFKEVTSIATESAVFDVSRYDEANYAADDNLIDELRKSNLNHTEDALIGETAIKNNLILITNDKTFLSKVIALQGKAITLDQFLQNDF